MIHDLQHETIASESLMYQRSDDNGNMQRKYVAKTRDFITHSHFTCSFEMSQGEEHRGEDKWKKKNLQRIIKKLAKNIFLIHLLKDLLNYVATI